MAPTEEKFLTVKDASEKLGVAPNTLRSWGSSGKIDEYRHPVNNYRLYRLEDVVALRRLLLKPGKQSGLMALSDRTDKTLSPREMTRSRGRKALRRTPTTRATR